MVTKAREAAKKWKQETGLTQGAGAYLWVELGETADRLAMSEEVEDYCTRLAEYCLLAGFEAGWERGAEAQAKAYRDDMAQAIVRLDKQEEEKARGVMERKRAALRKDEEEEDWTATDQDALETMRSAALEDLYPGTAEDVAWTLLRADMEAEHPEASGEEITRLMFEKLDNA